MKTHFTKLGFELIFSLSLILIMVLPPMVFAQKNVKDLEIKIANGDTIINGKNIKDLSFDERKQALKDMKNIHYLKGNIKNHIIIKKSSPSDGNNEVVIENQLMDNDAPEIMEDAHIMNDPANHELKSRIKLLHDKDSTFAFNYRINPMRGRIMEDRARNLSFSFREHPIELMHHKNMQSFNYVNVGNDGISTHISFRVTDASPEKTKAMAGVEKNDLAITDLNLVPEFSSGKTVLTFNLQTKASAEVKLTDSDGKTIWNDKTANGNFTKSFTLGLNGVYYLQVKQGNKTTVKRVVKED